MSGDEQQIDSLILKGRNLNFSLPQNSIVEEKRIQCRQIIRIDDGLK